MAEPWSSPLPWAPHQRALARWAAERWNWSPEDGDWPSALALLCAAEDEGHTALDWEAAPALWQRRFADLNGAPPFALPAPESWPTPLFAEGWLRWRPRGRSGQVQTGRQAALEARLLAALERLTGSSGPQEPGEGQDEAVARSGRVPLLILAGGPGTGKTTTLRAMTQRWSQLRPGLRMAVAAPTGRAAARAREAFQQAEPVPECLTLHRLLGLRPGLGQAWHGPHRPLPFDLVIVDEASMLDLRTAVCLVEALAPGAALVLVGDPGQLPSVDSGAVLADLLDHPSFRGAVVRLKTRHRLAGASGTLARVFDLLGSPGLDPEAAADLLAQWGGGQNPDFRWEITGALEDPGPRAVAAWGPARTLSVETLGSRILLSPVHAGPGGTQALGALLDRSLGRAPGTLEEGLPWMIRRNLPHLELSNGDRGLLVRSQGRLWFHLPGAPPRPFVLVAEDGEPAWAVTVHKSQGSEFTRVVLVLPPEDSPHLVRELLYTGLTRAKETAVLVASRQALVAALGRGVQRQTGWGHAGTGAPVSDGP